MFTWRRREGGRGEGGREGGRGEGGKEKGEGGKERGRREKPCWMSVRY